MHLLKLTSIVQHLRLWGLTKFFSWKSRKGSWKIKQDFQKIHNFFQGNLKFFQNYYKFSTKPIKVFILYLTIFQKKKLTRFFQKFSKNQTRFSNKILKPRQGLWTKFSKNPTRFFNNFSKQGFHDILEKSNKIFRKLQHLFQKSRKILQDFQTFLRKRTLDNFVKTITQFSQNPNKVFIKFSKDMTISFQEFHMFSQIQILTS